MSVIRRGKEKGGGTIRMGREKRNEGIEEKKGRKENTNCIKKTGKKGKVNENGGGEGLKCRRMNRNKKKERGEGSTGSKQKKQRK